MKAAGNAIFTVLRKLSKEIQSDIVYPFTEIIYAWD